MFIQKGIVGALLASLILGGIGCGYNQEMKNVWKGTKNLWYNNVSVPASIDYDDTGEMSEYKTLLASNMVGIDGQLTSLEKIMNNADKPPTNEWVQALFARFPWLSGFTGIKSDGVILGQMPSVPIKPLDFTPLLVADDKQNLRALRGYVQDTPMGPEVFLATPLYDAQNFLGVVSVYFDMRELLQFSNNPDDIMIISPYAVLWSGRYSFAATPLSGVDWLQVIKNDSSGTVSSGGSQFYWSVRYLGNLPLIFATSVDSTVIESADAEGGTVESSVGQSAHSRTGPTDSTGLVLAEPIVFDPSSVEVVEQPASTEQAPASSDLPEAPVEAQEPIVIDDTPKQQPARKQVRRKPIIMPEPLPEPAPAPKPIVTPSPIYPDQPDDAVEETTTEEPAETSTDAPAETPAETSSSTSMPSPIHPDETDTATEQPTSEEPASEAPATEAQATEAPAEESAPSTTESTDTTTESSSEESAPSRPSPFGPQ